VIQIIAAVSARPISEQRNMPVASAPIMAFVTNQNAMAAITPETMMPR